ncbi:GNAT family N-acetyltransferase [Saccharibacillus sacchari]|uniref:GNAT family N-acetyltransferase n=1 Tax=Saccharibacillus sacchari TaxID=456493 RepID=A0ACC6P6R1_9BACL
MEGERIGKTDKVVRESEPGTLPIELLKQGDPLDWRIETYLHEAEWWSIRMGTEVFALIGCLRMGAEEAEIVNLAVKDQTDEELERLVRLLKQVDKEWRQRGVRRLMVYLGAWETDLLYACQRAGFRIVAAEHDYYADFQLAEVNRNGLRRLDRLMLELLAQGRQPSEETLQTVSKEGSQEPRPTIRRAELRDSRSLLSMKKRLDRETTSMLYEPGERRLTDGDQLEQIRSLLRSSNSLMLVAESEGEVVGYLEATGGKVRRNQHTIYIVVGILEACTGKGLGRRLFEDLFEWATRRQVLRAELTVQASNQRAYRLYRSLGFRLEGVMRGALMIEGEPVDLYQMGCDLRTIKQGRVDK